MTQLTINFKTISVNLGPGHFRIFHSDCDYAVARGTTAVTT